MTHQKLIYNLVSQLITVHVYLHAKHYLTGLYYVKKTTH